MENKITPDIIIQQKVDRVKQLVAELNTLAASLVKDNISVDISSETLRFMGNNVTFNQFIPKIKKHL